MIEASEWLAERLARAPASLRERVLEALEGDGAGGAGDFAQRLHDAGERLLAEAGRDGAGREVAITLLAADALITLAAEWVAETRPDALASFGQ